MQMTKKNTAIIVLLGLITGLILVYPDKLGICFLFGNPDCLYSFPVFTIGEPLFNFSLCALLVLVILHFLRDEVFKFWLKFAYVWIPLSVLIIFTTQTSSNAWAVGGPTRETVSWIMGGLFVVTSLILIAYKSYQLRHHP
jgi:hypothetical protein